MKDVTLTAVDQLEAGTAEPAGAFRMDEEAFRGFYDRTSPALWVYLLRLCGDRETADDLLQETYYRLLRHGGRCATETHRRHYVFHVATNLARDRRRRGRSAPVRVEGDPGDLAGRDAARDADRRLDVHRALGRLNPRERALLWLAYAHGSSHSEIGDILAVKTASVKLLLFRARRKLAGLLRALPAREGSDRAER